MTSPPQNPPRIVAQDSALLIVDIQERLVPVMYDHKKLIRRTARLIQGAYCFGVPLLVTEQYPRGLGETVAELSRHIVDPLCIEQKTRFSACIEPVRTQLELCGARSVIVAGIEAHVCVLGTCLDLIEAGYQVYLPWDGVTSRRREDKQAALERLTQAGAVPSTVEAVLFEWLGDADDRRFRQIQELIKGSEA